MPSQHSWSAVGWMPEQCWHLTDVFFRQALPECPFRRQYTHRSSFATVLSLRSIVPVPHSDGKCPFFRHKTHGKRGLVSDPELGAAVGNDCAASGGDAVPAWKSALLSDAAPEKLASPVFCS